MAQRQHQFGCSSKSKVRIGSGLMRCSLDSPLVNFRAYKFCWQYINQADGPNRRVLSNPSLFYAFPLILWPIQQQVQILNIYLFAILFVLPVCIVLGAASCCCSLHPCARVYLTLVVMCCSFPRFLLPHWNPRTQSFWFLRYKIILYLMFIRNGHEKTM